MAKKTWTEKLNTEKSVIVKTIDKKFADIPEGSIMLIATPAIIRDYVAAIPLGSSVDLSTLRNDLATTYNADKTCPVTTGIFLRIVAEAAYEEHLAGKPVEAITPFWRIINPKMKVAKKLACGPEFIEKQREKEGI